MIDLHSLAKLDLLSRLRGGHMQPGALEVGLLNKIMVHSLELQEDRATVRWEDFVELLPEDTRGRGNDKVRYHLSRHLNFLENCGFLRQPESTVRTNPKRYEVTAKGQMFVQPELAEFGQQAMLPQVVKSLEDQIQVLTYPREEKEGLLYKLREAIAKQAPEVIAKVIVEVGSKIVSGGA